MNFLWPCVASWHGNVIDLNRVFSWRHCMFDLHLASFVSLLPPPVPPRPKARICNHAFSDVTSAKRRKSNQIFDHLLGYWVCNSSELRGKARGFALYNESAWFLVTSLWQILTRFALVCLLFLRRKLRWASQLWRYSIARPRFAAEKIGLADSLFLRAAVICQTMLYQ